MRAWLHDRLSELVELLRLWVHQLNQKGSTMKRDEQTYCECGEVLGDDEDVCDYCGAPRPGFCAEGYDPEDFEDEDQRLDDPRHGQAAGINRDNRGGQ